jgi:peptide/nickel transport system substrate-binding protein
VEWIYIPDSATAAAALNAGEADIWEQVPPDLIPLLSKNKQITVKNNDPLGSMGMIRFNFLHPPFNNEKLRRAVLYAVDQKDYVIGIAGDKKNGKPCYSYFTCGTPLASEVAAEPLKGKRDLAKAAQLVKESGYKGEKVVILDPVEAHLAHAQAVVTAQKLREIGMNVELAAIDWGTQSARRQIKDPPDKNPGAWNIFHTWGGGLAMNSPLSNTPTPTPCDGKNWFGWPCDEELEKIRLEFPLAPPDKQKEIVERLQKRFYEVVPYIPAGQFLAPIAYRKNLSGIQDTPRLVLWNIEKK